MKTYAKFGILTVLIVGSLVWLAMGGISETQTYYKTIPELQKLGAQAQGQRLRVAGNVEAGSILKNGSRVTFVLEQGAQHLKVAYNGQDPLPDTFKAGAQALADGQLGPNGVFEANKIQAKCASKYEAKPPQNLTHQSSAPSKMTEVKVPALASHSGS